MEWAAPAYLWLCLGVLPVLALAVRGARRRRRGLTGLASEGPSARQLGKAGRESALARGGVLAAAALLLVLACCGPQWGMADEERQAKGIDILIALDTSRSMLADDLKPTRLAAAKEAIIALTADLQGDRIGLIAFAGSAFLVCPLTGDYGVFGGALAEAGAGTIPLGGTSLAAALKEARRVFSRSGGGGKLLIVVSDGEDQGGEYAAEARTLRGLGVTVSCVGAGTLQGGLIPLSRGDFFKDRGGAVVKSRLQPAPLKELAGPGGRLVELAGGRNALVDLYPQELANRERTTERSGPRLRERFQIPLALALALLTLEPCLGSRRER